NFPDVWPILQVKVVFRTETTADICVGNLGHSPNPAGILGKRKLLLPPHIAHELDDRKQQTKPSRLFSEMNDRHPQEWRDIQKQLTTDNKDGTERLYSHVENQRRHAREKNVVKLKDSDSLRAELVEQRGTSIHTSLFHT
ncbi:hypothetical protein FOZ63_014449, partial [Perkinsus olseni]